MLRPELVVFAELMEAKLAKHDAEFHVDDYTHAAAPSDAPDCRSIFSRPRRRTQRPRGRIVLIFAFMLAYHCEDDHV